MACPDYSRGLNDYNIDQVDKALDLLHQNPDRLYNERLRFCQTPAGTPSELAETPPLSITYNIEERIEDLKDDYRASLPDALYNSEVQLEIYRLGGLDGYEKRNIRMNMDVENLARQCVKQRWMEQGIWDDKWKDRPMPGSKWKHEEPLEPLPNPGTHPSGHPIPSRLTIVRQRETVNRESTEEERHREASRPFFQFLYQVSLERLIIMEEINDPGFFASEQSLTAPYLSPPIDVNSEAYNIVKRRWLYGRIWDRRWGPLPGMSWKHEQPFEEFMQDKLFDNGLSPAIGPCWVVKASSLEKHPPSGYPWIWSGQKQQHRIGGNSPVEPGPVIQHPQPKNDAVRLADAKGTRPVVQQTHVSTRTKSRPSSSPHSRTGKKTSCSGSFNVAKTRGKKKVIRNSPLPVRKTQGGASSSKAKATRAQGRAKLIRRQQPDPNRRQTRSMAKVAGCV